MGFEPGFKYGKKEAGTVDLNLQVFYSIRKMRFLKTVYIILKADAKHTCLLPLAWHWTCQYTHPFYLKQHKLNTQRNWYYTLVLNPSVLDKWVGRSVIFWFLPAPCPIWTRRNAKIKGCWKLEMSSGCCCSFTSLLFFPFFIFGEIFFVVLFLFGWCRWINN